MDFNSNDEYLRAFPPNFGPPIDRPGKESQHDLKSSGLPPKDPRTLMADMALLRDEKMVIDDGDGGALEIMLSLEAPEASVLDSERLGAIAEAICYVPDASAEDFTIDHSEGEKTIVAEEVTQEAPMEDAILEEPNLIKTETLTETQEKADLDVGTEDPTMAFEKTTIKAKAICEVPRFTVKFTESTSTGITGFDEELGAEAGVDRIVVSIMNEIADIEADMEDEDEDGGLEAVATRVTQHQKVPPTCEKPVGINGQDLICQDHVGPSEGHCITLQTTEQAKHLPVNL